MTITDAELAESGSSSRSTSLVRVVWQLDDVEPGPSATQRELRERAGGLVRDADAVDAASRLLDLSHSSARARRADWDLLDLDRRTTRSGARTARGLLDDPPRSS